MPSPILGIDLGGTKIEAAFLDPDAFEKPLARVRVPTERENGYDHILDQIARACEMASAEAGLPMPEVLGIGTPGSLNPGTGLLHGSNTTCLNGRPLKADLERRLGVRVEMANDANCFALAEATFGSARDYPVVFGIILGTGVGGGLVVNRHVLNGCHGIAGEWGQLILDPAGPLSVYGTRGTIEAHIAGFSLENFYEEHTGARLSLREIVSRARAGTDPAARATLDRLVDCFASSLAMLVNSIDADAYVLGGGVGNIDELYSPETREKIAARVFTPQFRAAILRPVLGDSAGVFGAALLALPDSHSAK